VEPILVEALMGFLFRVQSLPWTEIRVEKGSIDSCTCMECYTHNYSCKRLMVLVVEIRLEVCTNLAQSQGDMD
jgi:hypothetical protein